MTNEERVCPECDRGMAMDDKNAWCDECAADDPLGAMIAAGGGEVTLVPEGFGERVAARCKKALDEVLVEVPGAEYDRLCRAERQVAAVREALKAFTRDVFADGGPEPGVTEADLLAGAIRRALETE